MIPLRLSLEGIFSYQTEQVIDFEQLGASGLFGIFGPVGSGKSTILDAITYALFENTDRFERQMKTKYNLMNLKSNTLRIDFTFSAGTDGAVYRIEVVGKRNKKKFEEVKSIERRFFRKNGDTWEPEQLSSIESVIGLNKENFTRTVIIPQGKFHAFMKLSPKDRTTMLCELFDLGRYDLSGRVRTLTEHNSAKIAFLSGNLEQFISVTDETVATAAETLNKHKTEALTISKSLETAVERGRVLENIRVLFNDIEIAQRQHDGIEKDRLLIDRKQQELERFETAVRDCGPALRSLDERLDRYTKSENELKRTKEEIADSGIKCVEAQKKIALLKPEYDTRENLRATASEIRRIIEIKTGGGEVPGRITKKLAS